MKTTYRPEYTPTLAPAREVRQGDMMEGDGCWWAVEGIDQWDGWRWFHLGGQRVRMVKGEAIILIGREL